LESASDCIILFPFQRDGMWFLTFCHVILECLVALLLYYRLLLPKRLLVFPRV
jgi:hypothetical protein